MSLGGADQIINPSRTHLFQRILCWDTAIHQPGALNPRFHEGKISHTVFRSDPEISPMSPYLLYCQDILHMPQENLPVSIPMPQPLEHNQNVCHGCIQNVSPFS